MYSKLTIKFDNEESFLNAVLHFNEVCNIIPDEVNNELKTITFEVLYDKDIINIEEEIDNVPHIQGYTFMYGRE